MGVSGTTDLLLSYFYASHYIIRLKLEYLTIVVGPIAFLHFFSSLIPGLFSQRFLLGLWSYTLVIMIVTLILPFNVMTENLTLFQTHLMLWTAVVIGRVIWAAMKKRPFAKLFLLSGSIIVVGVINDVYASVSSEYHLNIIEFCMFFFLFFQAQVVGIKLNDSVIMSARLQAEKQNLERKHHKVVLDSQLDHLTGLYNRKALEERLALAWESAQQDQEMLSIIIMDLDHFKKVNDTHGHLIGDEVLVYVASLLRSQNLRKGDFVSRYGGEEFVIVLPDTRLEDARNIAEKLRVAIKQATVYEDNQLSLNITTSFGVYATIPSETNYVDALRKADEALYKAKKSGRNRVVSTSY
jgi:diguanylate cyclase (GGDEF)-like protein